MEGEDILTPGRFYLAVVQAILIFGSEMWVVTPHTGRALEGFHHKVARQIMGKHPWVQDYESWKDPLPPLKISIQEAV